MQREQCDVFVDLVDNALGAGATHIAISFCETDSAYELCVKDNGCGMSEEVLLRALNTSYSDTHKHPGRKEGWGLPWLKSLTEHCGGALHIDSKINMGTQVSCSLRKETSPPLGDWCAMIVLLSARDEVAEMLFSHRIGERNSCVSRNNLISIYGDLRNPLSFQTARRAISLQKTTLFE